jgi:hypothetical protein
VAVVTLADGTRIELRTGWRAVLYRGRRRRSTRRVGQWAIGLALYTAVHLQ